MDIYDLYLSFIAEPIAEPNRKEEIFKKIIKKIEPLINKNVKLVNKYHQEDLKQEIELKIYNVMKDQKFILIISEENDLKANDLYDSSLLKKFIDQSKEINNLYQNLEYSNNQKIFNEKFNRFIGKIKFIKFLAITIKNYRIDYVRIINRNQYSYLDDSIELEDTSNQDKEHGIVQILEEEKLTSKDRDFIKLFIKDDILLTQLEVAKILNVSHQYVSQKYNSIKEKVRHK